MKKHLAIILPLALLTLLTSALAAEEEDEFFGRIYFHYFHDFTSTDADPGLYESLQGIALENPGQDNGFAFTRFYFGYDRELNENFGVRFLLDVDYDQQYSQNQAGNLGSSSRNLRPYVKNAYLTMKCRLIEGSRWYFGMVAMPFTTTPESHWGYRSLAPMGMDLAGWGSTADVGVAWKGLWSDMYELQFAAANGEGYRRPETDMMKLFELRPTVYLLEKDVTLSAFASYEPDAEGTDEDALILSGMAGYDHEFFRVGAEYSLRTLSDAVVTDPATGAVDDLNQNVISAWAHVKPLDKLAILGRYDMYDSDTDADNDGESLLIVGVDYHPTKMVRFIPNIQMQMNERDDDPATPDFDESVSRNIAFLTFEVQW
ncbi:MAG: hypothetical protein C4524_07600 [Candidatus Zixiibacteriota bacterium]|nr:MAG: hypothetical protein C4524_07600 [candidate division Zixibacteria bacterium]